MTEMRVRGGGPLRGSVRVPGDKSISHRSVLLGALAEGESCIQGFLRSGDCLATLSCVQALGVEVERVSAPSRHEGEGGDAGALTVQGRGLRGLLEPGEPLDCRRSGTTMRLLAGILAGQSFESVLTGDPQLLRRPMRRIVEPLRAAGGDIEDSDGRAPLTIRGRGLRGCEHKLAVASAQVKSAVLLAGLNADGPTTVLQPGPARDHTERMLAAMGADIETEGLVVRLQPCESLSPLTVSVPGDFSSAAYPLVAALLVERSDVTVEGVGINPTRTGLLDVLQGMGAMVSVQNAREQGGEPAADVHTGGSSLRGIGVGGDTVVRMIDEFPILAVAATQASGRTTVREATELRVKETDRIATVVEELSKLGARIEGRADGFVVEGPTRLRASRVDCHGDHRLGMALAVAGLVADGELVVDGAECIDDSFPGFSGVMRRLGAEMEIAEAGRG
jgi:3-phosphoshikimate 1-carboxyvinyltransferase